MKSRSLFIVAGMALLSTVFAGEIQPPFGRIDLSSWRMQSTAVDGSEGATISQPGSSLRNAYLVHVPTTVLTAFVKNGVYPDPRLDLNAYKIPDSSDEFNQKHDLAKYSHLPNQRNPWRDPYWFRTEFELPSPAPAQQVWLHFDAINYRAEVWLNGNRIAGKENMAGMFQRFQFNITGQTRAGANALAVKIFPVDNPGTPDTQLEVLGPDRGYDKAIKRDITEIMSIGYDCMMTVPDRNMGIWQPVWIDFSGPVSIRNPFVVTDLPLPETNRATLAVSAELVNASSAPVKGILRGTVEETGLKFEQPVELGPNETNTVKIDSQPVMENPRLWWPVNYGEQYLYTLALKFEAGSQTSDTRKVKFGVRKVGYEMHEINGWHGRRMLINGQKILCRGGYIQPELMFDWDARRMESELQYYARDNLNLIYFEDIPNPPEPFLELCDKYGLLFGNVFYSCFWLRPGSPYPNEFPLLERCTVDLVKRYRNHPSLSLYMAMNEEDTKEKVYEMWRKHIHELDGTRWFIPSAYFPSDRKDAGEWFKKDLPTGMTDKGASYSWAEPVQYFNWVREKRNWMFMMESGSASLPPISSLHKFLPNVEARNKGEKLFPLNAAWAHHGANQYYRGYDAALRRLLGEPESVVDYCWKGHLLTADQHRSMYEAVNHRMWDVTSGFTEWKINTCEPNIQWQTFDYYLKPMVSWFYIKKACEPLHVQLNLPDHKVSIINPTLASVNALEVRARVFDLNANLLWETVMKTNVSANSYQEVFDVTEPPNATPVYFVKLEMKDSRGKLVSDNFYWLKSRATDDYKALETLPPVLLVTTCEINKTGDDQVARVKVTNPSTNMAFFIQLALTQANGGAEVLPVLWDDNYFNLLPGESREVTARFTSADAGSGKPLLETGGWNIGTDFDCSSLDITPKTPKVGEPCVVTGKVGRTFLDGSRTFMTVDGKATGSSWAWARDGKVDTVTFPLQFRQNGKHNVSVGGRTIEVSVQP